MILTRQLHFDNLWTVLVPHEAHSHWLRFGADPLDSLVHSFFPSSLLPTRPWLGSGSNVSGSRSRSRSLIKTDASQQWLLVPFCQHWSTGELGPTLVHETWWKSAGRGFLLGREEWRSPSLRSPSLPSALNTVMWCLRWNSDLIVYSLPKLRGRPCGEVGRGGVKRAWAHDETPGPYPAWNRYLALSVKEKISVLKV